MHARVVVCGLPALHSSLHQSKVAERYEVTRPLGEGGFGKAFVVLDKQDFRQYVLKRMDCGSEEEAANAVKEVHAPYLYLFITSARARTHTHTSTSTHMPEKSARFQSPKNPPIVRAEAGR